MGDSSPHQSTDWRMRKTWTTYGKVNEWDVLPEARHCQTIVPVTLTDRNWTYFTKIADIPTRAQSADYNMRFKEALPVVIAYTQDNTWQVPYRCPKPAPSRIRRSRIGGNWRHITEVLDHCGSRVVFVDGMVAINGGEQCIQGRQLRSLNRPHLSRKFSDGILNHEAARKSWEKVHLPTAQNLPKISAYKRSHKLATDGSTQENDPFTKQ